MTLDKKPSTDLKANKKEVAKPDPAGVKAPDCAEGEPKGRESAKRTIEITETMTTTISSSKELITNGCSKMEAAKEAYDLLAGYTRSQILYVFIEGCALSKAGASTYYQGIKKKKTTTK